VSCAPSGDEGPTVYIVFQISESLNKPENNNKNNNNNNKNNNNKKRNKIKRRGKTKQQLCESEAGHTIRASTNPTLNEASGTIIVRLPQHVAYGRSTCILMSHFGALLVFFLISIFCHPNRYCFSPKNISMQLMR
jgi:hypothetical protein